MSKSSVVRVVAFLITLSLVTVNEFNQAAIARKEPASDLIECLVLEQKDMKIGKVKGYLGKDRVRVDVMNGQTTIVSAAPDWDVVLYNRDGEYFKVSRDKWKREGLDRMVNNRGKFFTKEKNPPQPIMCMGFSALKTSRPGWDDEGAVSALYRTKQAAGHSRIEITYIASSHLGLTKDVYAFLEGLYMTHPSASVLLDCTNAKDGKPYKHPFATTSVRHEKVSKNLFSVPNKLRRAPTLTAVITGRGIEEMMLNFSGAK